LRCLEGLALQHAWRQLQGLGNVAPAIIIKQNHPLCGLHASMHHGFIIKTVQAIPPGKYVLPYFVLCVTLYFGAH